MLKTDYIVLGLAGLAVWFILQGKKSGAASVSDFVKKAAPDFQGWQYFNDGTSISPDGAYYHNGELVWSPAS